jgi:hypothetical protein
MYRREPTQSLEHLASRLIRDEVVLRAFKKAFPSDAEQRLRRLARKIPPDNDEYDELADVLGNEARTYLTFHARPDAGDEGDVFSIEVNGLGGVYFIWAPEFDEVGYFDSLGKAERGVYDTFFGDHRVVTSNTPSGVHPETEASRRCRPAFHDEAKDDPLSPPTVTGRMRSGNWHSARADPR